MRNMHNWPDPKQALMPLSRRPTAPLCADWRTDTTSDLQLILFLNVLLVVLGSVAKRTLVDPLEGAHDSAWIDIYDVSNTQHSYA